ncbi:guanylate kinase, partial [Bacillus licheniformis]|uniref:guanylate kinase n=1 Tax=Bacillus licheniformis TaxID=1402 RepID=UPI000FB8AED0
VSGAAGTGKGTIISSVLENNEKLVYSVSMTTRAPRVGEVEGKSYYFVSKEHFEKLIAEDAFVEYAFVHTDYYGTPKANLENEVKNGKIVILEIDVQGAEEVMKKYPNAV